MPDDTNPDFTAFKECMKNQFNLDLETLDESLFQPLKDLVGWWNQQSVTTKGFTAFLAGIAGKAFANWLKRVAAISSEEVAVALAGALVSLIATVALSTFLSNAGQCLASV